MRNFGMNYRVVTAYHPQISSQVEVTNRELKRFLEKMIHHNWKNWLEKLDEALCAYRIAFKTSIGNTLYRLVYGKVCHFLVKLEHKVYLMSVFHIDIFISFSCIQIQCEKRSKLSVSGEAQSEYGRAHSP